MARSWAMVSAACAVILAFRPAVLWAGTDLVRSRRRAGAQAFAQLIEELPSDETAALLAALPALEHLRELEDVPRARTTQLQDQQAGR